MNVTILLQIRGHLSTVKFKVILFSNSVQDEVNHMTQNSNNWCVSLELQTGGKLKL